ncbi:MAG: hypothetical protein WCT01_03125 [Candidatus Shapirobacteria bacterium]
MTSPDNCWLIFIDPTTVAVGLYRYDTSGDLPNQAIGKQETWDGVDSTSLIQATSLSLDSAASTLQLSENQEPSDAIFVVPPYWVDTGSLLPQLKKTIEPLCRELKLKPLGFMAQDELVVESLAHTPDSQPSFIFVTLTPTNFSLSLVSFGAVQHSLPPLNYSPSNLTSSLEKALYELKSNFALPPHIIIFGPRDPNFQSILSNYRWQNPEYPDIFLQLPEIQFWHYPQLLELFHQLVGKPTSVPTLDVSTLPPPPVQIPSSLSEVDPIELGFSAFEEAQNISPPQPPLLLDEPELNIQPDLPVQTILTNQRISKFHFKLPKLSFPPTLVSSRLLWLPLIVVVASCGLFALIPSVNLTVFITPQQFDKPVAVAVNQSATGSQLSVNSILINKDIQVSLSVATTGQKVTGQKAKGEITIFNKSDKVINLPKALVLQSTSGNQYELLNPIQVPSAAANLEKGIIEMGQTKVLIGAANFGPEFNLTGSQDYKIKDYGDLIAHSTTDISGGTKQNINVVSPTDKSRLLAELDNKINQQVNVLIATQSDPLLINNSAFVNSKKIDLTREIGEEANELLASAKLSISFHQLSAEQKQNLVDSVVSSFALKSKHKYLPQNFIISFVTPPKALAYAGTLRVNGWLEPQISAQNLTSKLTLLSPKSLPQILRKEVPRFYDWEINSRLGYINIIPLTPVFPGQIHLHFKVK